MPCQAGALALVPPMTSSVPSTITRSPVSGSASSATSGTPRSTPTNEPPAFACHDGTSSKYVAPPPPAYQATSVGPLPMTVVPPTPIAYGLAAGYSTPGRPAGTPLTPAGPTGQNEPVSPLEVKRVWPCAAACLRVLSTLVWKPVTCAIVSHSPAEKLACRVVLSVTQRVIVAAMSSFASEPPL